MRGVSQLAPSSRRQGQSWGLDSALGQSGMRRLASAVGSFKGPERHRSSKLVISPPQPVCKPTQESVFLSCISNISIQAHST